MLWKISVEAKMPGDPRTVYRLRIDDTVIAERLTTAQAEFLVREILDRETDEAKMTGASFWPRLEGPRRPGQRRSIFRRGALEEAAHSRGQPTVGDLGRASGTHIPSVISIRRAF